MDGWGSVSYDRCLWLCTGLLFYFLFAAMARWYHLVSEQERKCPEDPLYVSYEQEWLEAVVRGEGSRRDKQALEEMEALVGYRPRESDGVRLWIDYIYVGRLVAVEVPWRATLRQRLSDRLDAAIARDYARKSGGFYPLFGEDTHLYSPRI